MPTQNSNLKPSGELRVIYNNYATLNATAGICQIRRFQFIDTFMQEATEKLILVICYM